MKEHPMIFAEPMVLALLDGRKTVTRRPIKPSNSSWNGRPWPKETPFERHKWEESVVAPSPTGNPGPYLKVPYDEMDDHYVHRTRHRVYPKWSPGDLIWVKETFFYFEPEYEILNGERYDLCGEAVAYKASHPDVMEKWTSPLFMPRWASRITLKVVSVRTERLQDITEEDAVKEGIDDGGCVRCGEPERLHPTDGDRSYSWYPCNVAQPDYRDAFFYLWSQLYPDSSPYSLHENPWVWRIEFEVVK